METISEKFRIGEKIGLGFGLVGVIFLAVVWQYHNTLQRTLSDHQRLLDVFAERKGDALSIESSVLRAQAREKAFLLSRDQIAAQEVSHHVQQAMSSANDMATIDAEAKAAAARINELMDVYHRRFQAVVDAWQTMGLDHDSGLQGAFRNAVHELESMAGHLKVDHLYLQLLQIRRSEKDLGLRREEQYRRKVLDLIQVFKDKTAASELEDGVRQRLLQEIEHYRETFLDYAGTALSGREVGGGKGPFRQAAHRMEALLNSHHVPELGHDILQLRRREKDYLLRGDKQYVDLALAQIQDIYRQVRASTVPEPKKTRFAELLNNYQRDFLALVEQNGRIDGLTQEMREAVEAIGLLVQKNVAEANREMDRMTSEINASSQAKERIMLLSVLLATLLGIAFAVVITLHIVHRLRKMAGFLDRLAFEEPAERLRFSPNGRDEVNAMAGSVNAMADHKARFIEWWQTAVQESDACERLENLRTTVVKSTGQKGVKKLQAAEAELREALSDRRSLLSGHYRKLHRLNGWIIERADMLLRQGGSRQSETALDSIRYSARSAQNILEMISEHQQDRSA